MDLRPLRRRDFRLLYAAQSVSFLGTMVTYVALPWQMYALTGSSASRSACSASSSWCRCC